MLKESYHHLAAQRGICKQAGVFLGVAILLAGALGRLDGARLLWAAAPLLLLWLTEAGYAAEQRRSLEQWKQQKGKGELW